MIAAELIKGNSVRIPHLLLIPAERIPTLRPIPKDNIETERPQEEIKS